MDFIQTLVDPPPPYSSDPKIDTIKINTITINIRLGFPNFQSFPLTSVSTKSKRDVENYKGKICQKLYLIILF